MRRCLASERVSSSTGVERKYGPLNSGTRQALRASLHVICASEENTNEEAFGIHMLPEKLFSLIYQFPIHSLAKNDDPVYL